LKKPATYIIVMITVAQILHSVSCMAPKKGPQRALDTAVSRKMQFDAIIVPGIPFKNGSWDSVMKARVIWSWVLYNRGIAKNIIYSGDAVYSPYKESVIMGLYAEKLGIPKEHIFCDTQAKHSTENIYYSYLLAKGLGFKSLALATDPFQSFLLKSYTRRRFGTPIYHLPFVTDTIAKYNYLNPEINPDAAKVNEFLSIREKESFGKRLKGTFGRGIDWSQYEDGKLEAL
jgi:uncharacterized SAM-binding protein YcdF (DUF218 family)